MPTTCIYTLSLHDALPILIVPGVGEHHALRGPPHVVNDGRREIAAGSDGHPLEDLHLRRVHRAAGLDERDRKSTRLNSSHTVISYAVFCLKKKIKTSARGL